MLDAVLMCVVRASNKAIEIKIKKKTVWAGATWAKSNSMPSSKNDEKSLICWFYPVYDNDTRKCNLHIFKIAVNYQFSDAKLHYIFFSCKIDFIFSNRLPHAHLFCFCPSALLWYIYYCFRSYLANEAELNSFPIGFVFSERAFCNYNHLSAMPFKKQKTNKERESTIHVDIHCIKRSNQIFMR